MHQSDLIEKLSLCTRVGKISVTKGAVCGDSNAMFFAPGDDNVLDGAIFQMIQDLIAGKVSLSCYIFDFLEIWNVKVAHAPGKDLPVVL